MKWILLLNTWIIKFHFLNISSYSPTAGVGFCPLLKALADVSMKTSLICVTHFMTTPSMADFRYKSTEHSAFSWSSRAVITHFSTPTGIGRIVLPDTWPWTLWSKIIKGLSKWKQKEVYWCLGINERNIILSNNSLIVNLRMRLQIVLIFGELSNFQKKKINHSKLKKNLWDLMMNDMTDSNHDCKVSPFLVHNP